MVMQVGLSKDRAPFYVTTLSFVTRKLGWRSLSRNVCSIHESLPRAGGCNVTSAGLAYSVLRQPTLAGQTTRKKKSGKLSLDSSGLPSMDSMGPM